MNVFRWMHRKVQLDERIASAMERMATAQEAAFYMQNGVMPSAYLEERKRQTRRALEAAYVGASRSGSGDQHMDKYRSADVAASTGVARRRYDEVNDEGV